MNIPCPAWLRAWFARPSLDAWIRERVRKMHAGTLEESVCLGLTLPEDFRRETGQEPPADLDEQVKRAYREECVRRRATSPAGKFWDTLMNAPEPTEADKRAHLDELAADLKKLEERGIVLDAPLRKP